MSLVSFTPVVNGATATAASVNTPFSTIYNDYNGNITDANVSTSAAIAFKKIANSPAIEKNLGFNMDATGATLTTGYVTHATVTSTSYGGQVFLHWEAQVANGNSGADRNFDVQILCDGVTTGITPLTINFDSPFISGTTTNLSYSFTHSHTPSAGSHTWAVQYKGSAGGSLILSANTLKVTESLLNT